jgi:hypothetical protein
LGDGATEKEFMIRSGYSSRILLINIVPIPDPVPPPSECVDWKPYTDSRSSGPPSGRHRGPYRRAGRLQCSDPWPLPAPL